MASVAGMSRTAFAVRFTSSVGRPPMEYLTRWRMMLAADAMQRSGRTVSSAAFSVGYASEAAFSTAFKRVMGCSPRRYGGDPKWIASPRGSIDRKPAAAASHDLEVASAGS